jgi:hypothetical protein
MPTANLSEIRHKNETYTDTRIEFLELLWV